jgi:predicted flavoprotein YhiN
MNLSRLSLAAAAALVLTSAAVGAQDIEYQLLNNTDLTVLEFYTSPVDVDSWENDLLADIDLAPGESATVTIGDGRTQCDYDILFVFDDGQELTDTVNICDLASYELVQ